MRQSTKKVIIAGLAASLSLLLIQCSSGTVDGCTGDADCVGTQDGYCDLADHQCKPRTCVPDTCEEPARQCGSWGDGCGGSLNCGTCTPPATCNNNNGKCDSGCVPDCQGHKCGFDPQCGVQNCGTCNNPETCNQATGSCECTPDCSGRECGLDPVCGMRTCGTCAEPKACNASTGRCEACTPDCGTRDCGPVPNGCGVNCGTCQDAEICNGSACVLLDSIVVSPATATIQAGGTQLFTGQGKDQNGNNIDVLISWSSSDHAVATIDSSGLATGVDPGATTITAASGSVIGTATLTVSVPGPTFYVRTDGNNSCTGKNNAAFAKDPTDCAWKTITYGLSQVAPGETIRVQAGTYDEDVSPARSGTAGGPITLTTDGQVNMGSGNGFSVSNSFITIKGDFHLTNGGVWVGDAGTHDVTISGLKITTNGEGIAMTGDISNIFIEDNEVFGDGSYSHGITYQAPVPGQTWRAHHVTIRNNIVDNFGHNGIDINTNAEDFLIEGNTLNRISGCCSITLHNYKIFRMTVRNNTINLNSTDPTRKGIDLDGVRDSIIENNTIVGNGGGNGIMFDTFTTNNGQDHTNDNIIARNNTLSGSFEYAIQVWAVDAPNSNIMFENNVGDQIIFDGSGNAGITIRDPVSNPTDIDFYGSTTIANSTIEYSDGSVSSGDFTYGPMGSSKSISGTSDPIAYTKYSMTARPSSGTASVTVNKFDTSLAKGNILVNFAADTTNGNNMDFTISTLRPDTAYLVKSGASTLATPASDSAGKITFSNSVWPAEAFTLQEQ